MQGEEILKLLYSKYKTIASSLNFNNEIECLVAVLLSARARDSEVNKITKILFNRYKTFSDYAEADYDELRTIIKPLGLSPQKAKRIINLSIILSSNGETTCIPSTIEELIKLPGVGRKTAVVVMHETKQISNGIAVDTHNKRIANRIGIVQSENVKIIEKEMQKKFPKEKWRDISLLFVNLGRDNCHPKNPKCTTCPLNSVCKYAKENKRV